MDYYIRISIKYKPNGDVDFLCGHIVKECSVKHGADLCTIHITSKSNLSVLTCVIDYIEIVSGPLL